jgi:hypothetical protein
MHTSMADIGTMKFPRQFLLWSVRQWTHTPSGSPLLTDAFARMGMTAALPALERLLHALLATTTRPLCWRCPNAAAVSEDEWALLDAIALVQIGASERVAMRWSMSWPATTVRVALAEADRLAQEFTVAGLHLGGSALQANVQPARRLH